MGRIAYKDEHKSLHERWRDRISKGNILDRLMKHFDGEVDLTPSQVTVGLKIFDKMIPSLKHIEHSGMIEHHQMSIHDLNARLSALGHNPDEIWKQLNNNKVIDLKPEPVDQLEPSDIQPVEEIEPGSD